MSSFGSLNRLRAMGDERRLLMDTSVIHLYPAAAVDFPHFAIEVFEEWGGGVHKIGVNHAVGLFLNRNDPKILTLNSRLDGRGSAAFEELELQPRADLVYAFGLNDGLRIALAGTYAFDEVRRDQNHASANHFDLRVGLQVGKTDKSHLLFTIGLNQQDLNDETVGTHLNNTDGNGYSLEARAHLPIAANATLMPVVGLQLTAYDLEPATSEFTDGTFMLGFDLSPTRKVSLVAGVGAKYSNADSKHPTHPDGERTKLMLPLIVFGGEIQVGSMLFRAGVRHANTSTRDKLKTGAFTSIDESFEGSFRADFGLGLKFGPLLMDGLIERDFLRDGPHIIGGSRHGGGVFSEFSLTYHFDG